MLYWLPSLQLQLPRFDKSCGVFTVEFCPLSKVATISLTSLVPASKRPVFISLREVGGKGPVSIQPCLPAIPMHFTNCSRPLHLWSRHPSWVENFQARCFGVTHTSASKPYFISPSHELTSSSDWIWVKLYFDLSLGLWECRGKCLCLSRKEFFQQR